MDAREKAHHAPAADREGMRRPTAGDPLGRTKRLSCLAMTALCLSIACAKAPYEELEAAEAAVREARHIGAPTYLAEDYTALEAKLKTAQEEISQQYKRSEFSRDYSRANRLLMETRTEGERIIAEAQKRRDEAKAAALREKEQAKEAVHEVRELVERTEQASGSPLGGVPDELKAKADELNGTLAEMQTAIEANNHLAAKDKAQAVREKSQKLQNELQATRREK